MKKLSFLKQSLSLFSLLLILLINSCAPIFSEMQSARTVGKSNIDATVSFSSVGFRDTEEKESTPVQNHIGFQAAYGLSDNVDLRVRYAYLWVDDDGGTANILGFGPKFSLVKDRLAGYVPLGFAFGGDINKDYNSWQIHPTLIGTIPIVNKLEANPSFKVLIPFNKDDETTIAFNLGLGITLSEGFTLRPEYGMLFNPGEKGYYKQFSIGVTFNPPGRTDKD
ncbi:MAG: hypothetical protein ACI8P3_003404 [Saprospiraceae bacterium]|jgi:hypothetical protein